VLLARRVLLPMRIGPAPAVADIVPAEPHALMLEHACVWG
jgi:hypothetical protein